MNREWEKVKIGRSLESNEFLAIDEAFSSIGRMDAGLVIFFCSSGYNLDLISEALSGRFSCPVIGCTTAGEISTSGYQEKGIVAAGISSSVIKAHVECLHPLSSLAADSYRKMADGISKDLSFSKRLDPEKTFGLLFIDGMSMMEDDVIASLYSHFENISIIGGSSGDSLALNKTHIYTGGRFLSDAAVFTLVETTMPFTALNTNHFIPT